MSNGIIYKAFGLNWNSNSLLIPELPKSQEKKIDVFITTKDSDSLENNYVFTVKDQHIVLNIKNLANYSILNGKEIIINKKNNSDEDGLRTYLLGRVMAGILIQRGYLLLHANALEKSGKVIVCAGEKGFGKSTISYILVNKGWRLLTDDLVAINKNGEVLPGIPRIKLLRGVIKGLKLDINKFKHLRFNEDKYVISGNDVNPCFDVNKLSEIYFLEKDDNFDHKNTNKPMLICSERDKLLYLKKNLFRPQMIKGLSNESKSRYFIKLAELAKDVPCFRFHVPKDLMALEACLNEKF